jgi:hypothetical protein
MASSTAEPSRLFSLLLLLLLLLPKKIALGGIRKCGYSGYCTSNENRKLASDTGTINSISEFARQHEKLIDILLYHNNCSSLTLTSDILNPFDVMLLPLFRYFRMFDIIYFIPNQRFYYYVIIINRNNEIYILKLEAVHVSLIMYNMDFRLRCV